MSIARFRSTVCAAVLGAMVLLIPPDGVQGRRWQLEPDPVHLPIPEGLRPDVEFWKAIFAEHSRDRTVIHDAEDLRIIYEVLDTSPSTSERERQRQVRNAVRSYEKILKSLAVKEPSRRTREEVRVAKLFDGLENAHFSRSAYQVRGQRGLREEFREGLIRSGRCQATMIEIFEGYGVPSQITALPHVESSFNPAAHSHAGAVGVWQFTRSTGRHYLRIGYDLDERRDILASTHAAARHLLDNYERLGSWPLAVIAYNHGAGGLETAIEQLGTTDVETIIRNYKGRTFKFASRNFYPEFLAALEIAMNPESYFGFLLYERPPRITTLILPEHISLDAVSRALRVSPSELSVLNPALGRTFWSGNRALPKGYALKIPSGTVPDPWTALSTVPADQRWDKAPRPPVYRVRRGDTLSAISKKFGVPLRDLRAMNNIRGDRIYAGQEIYLPDGTAK
jgi:membrane-bound lytic murein transglycosylase D